MRGAGQTITIAGTRARNTVRNWSKAAPIIPVRISAFITNTTVRGGANVIVAGSDENNPSVNYN